MSGGFVMCVRVFIVYVSIQLKKYSLKVCFRSKDLSLVTHLNFATEAAFLF